MYKTTRSSLSNIVSKFHVFWKKEPFKAEVISKYIFQVFVGSASEGLLMPGDKVVGINHQDATKLTHLEAQNLIKHAGTSAKIDVVR